MNPNLRFVRHFILQYERVFVKKWHRLKIDSMDSDSSKQNATSYMLKECNLYYCY